MTGVVGPIFQWPPIRRRQLHYGKPAEVRTWFVPKWALEKLISDTIGAGLKGALDNNGDNGTGD